MLTAFIILSVISLLFIAAAVVILVGKGDDLIVGYNLASIKTRSHYHIRRLRVIVAILLILISALVPTFAVLLIKGYAGYVLHLFPATAFILIGGTFSAVHLWARKK